MMKKVIYIILALVFLLLFSSLISAFKFPTRYNPYTLKPDYYSVYTPNDNLQFKNLNGTNGTFVGRVNISDSLNVTNTIQASLFVGNGIFTNISVGGVNITGNLSVQSISISNSTNNGMDFCVLASGTCTINNNRVTANTAIFCMTQTGNLNLGSLHITARTAGISYEVTSTNVLGANKVACLLIEPII